MKYQAPTLLTNICTASALIFANTLDRIYAWLLNYFMAFRIPAPPALQGTAFEKQLCPYPRAVVNGITLYIKNDTIFWHKFHLILLSRKNTVRTTVNVICILISISLFLIPNQHYNWRFTKFSYFNSFLE
jgi:hypothetical protein